MANRTAHCATAYHKSSHFRVDKNILLLHWRVAYVFLVVDFHWTNISKTKNDQTHKTNTRIRYDWLGDCIPVVNIYNGISTSGLHIIRTNNNRWIYWHLFSSILILYIVKSSGQSKNDDWPLDHSVHRVFFAQQFLHFTSDENAFGKQQTQRKEIFLLLRSTSYILTHVFLPLNWRRKKKKKKEKNFNIIIMMFIIIVNTYEISRTTESRTSDFVVIYGVLVFWNAMHFVLRLFFNQPPHQASSLVSLSQWLQCWWCWLHRTKTAKSANFFINSCGDVRLWIFACSRTLLIFQYDMYIHMNV